MASAWAAAAATTTGFLLTVPESAARVGVTVSALVVDGLPTDSHDVPMTHLATENGVRPLGIRALRRADPAA